jgi:uncharacterized membrane protein
MDLRFERDEHEFARTFGFFDATFAVAMTLLVTTLDAPPGAFDTWSSLWDTMGFQLTAFAISFALVASYWWGNHRFVSSLNQLSPAVILTNLVMLGFVALIPFTTEALGAQSGDGEEVVTIVYAVNIAIVSFIPVLLHLLAWRDHLFRVEPTSEEVWSGVVDMFLPTAVFLASIPVAVLVSGEAARWCWLSLAFLGPILGRRGGRRREAALGRVATEPPSESGSSSSSPGPG